MDDESRIAAAIKTTLISPNEVDDVLARVRQLPMYCPDCHYRTCSVWQDTCADLRTLAAEVQRLREDRSRALIRRVIDAE